LACKMKLVRRLQPRRDWVQSSRALRRHLHFLLRSSPKHTTHTWRPSSSIGLHPPRHPRRLPRQQRPLVEGFLFPRPLLKVCCFIRHSPPPDFPSTATFTLTIFLSFSFSSNFLFYSLRRTISAEPRFFGSTDGWRFNQCWQRAWKAEAARARA
jgi:hypothetical protein